jgi:hypothetical protein
MMTRRLLFAVLTTAMLIGLGYAGPLRAENFSETASNFVDIHGNEVYRTRFPGHKFVMRRV